MPTPQPVFLLENPGTSIEREVPNPEFELTGGIDVGPDRIGDYRQKPLLLGIIESFSDAPRGFSEEIKEINYSVGLEYLFNHKYAVRVGYFDESEIKGNRKFMTLGLGFRYSVMSFDVSYLIPTAERRSPLNNSIKFSLIYQN